MRFLGASDKQSGERYGGKLRAFYEAGWRPLLGWIGVTACAVGFIAIPLLNAYLVPKGKPAAPTADLVQTLALLGTVLTTAGLRTYEKVCGVATPTQPVAPGESVTVNIAAPQPVAG